MVDQAGLEPKNKRPKQGSTGAESATGIEGQGQQAAATLHSTTFRTKVPLPL